MTTDMTTESINAVLLTTHDWGKGAKFFQTPGLTVEFETDYNSGQLRNGSGPYLFIAEVPHDQEPETHIVLKVADTDALRPESTVDVITPFEDTHWRIKEMIIHDRGGRIWEAPGAGDQSK